MTSQHSPATDPKTKTPADTQAESGFVHLHLHSEYSLLDGGNRIDRLIKRVKELGMDAVALTDHGNLFGAVSFYETCRREGIKPILGVEAYVAPGDRTDRTHTGVSDGGYHLVLLAENITGFNNLMYLCSQAYLSGFYYKPRIDRALLTTHNEGLIAINGHLGSEIGEHLLRFVQQQEASAWDKAVESARWHAQTFVDNGSGPRFFIELQHHIPEQNAINPLLVKLAREMDLPLVCDNDSHFLRAEDHDAHDTLICISTGKLKSDAARMRYTPELYVKSPEQMQALFAGDTYNNEVMGQAGREALANTRAIADRCELELPIGANHAPVVRVTIPDQASLPAYDDAAFDGDLTAWYKALSDRFTLEPFDASKASQADADEASLKADCDTALSMLAHAGMVWRYGPEVVANRQAHRAKWDRLERELKILSDKSISAYFLIVWDFVNWGRQRGIPANARGSGVGTMVGYVLGLSNACPVQYGLLFERFTDPDRSEYPDIDIDLCQDGRGEVINYVRQKYGHVAQIITFGTMKARAAIRDCARVLEVSLPVADRIAKAVPEVLNITIDEAMESEPDFRALCEGQAFALAKINKDLPPHQHINAQQVRQLIDNARTLEGQARHSSVHAAGVIVATQPLHTLVPLYRQTGAAEHEIVTQWDGPTCEKMGLLKMDFLGLRTLSVIERARQLIMASLDDAAMYHAVGREVDDGGPHPLDLERLTYDDPRVFDLFARGDTAGVFQFESGGMRRLLTEMKPDRLEDLIAANALFRPGPMDLIPDYNRRKHGTDPVPSLHPIVDTFTAETYGVMVYQEQVMQIVHELGGIPLRSAYTLIKAISKKKVKVINANRAKFIEGAVEKGLAKKEAEHLFDLILKFAGYGFNKSHSTGYAIVAYQTAYLKTYFPAFYMAAFLTFESQAQKVSDWIGYIENAKHTPSIDPKTGKLLRKGIEVKGPSVNLSQASFSVVYDEGEPRDCAHGHIRFGLAAIKGAGQKAIDAMIAERDGTSHDGDGQVKPYRSLYDFCERVPPGTVNKATIEALVKSGAFDELHDRASRSAMVASIDAAVSAGQKLARDKAAGQNQLFGFGEQEDEPLATADVQLANAKPWSEHETLANEKEALGFYVSSHPLEQWSAWSEVFVNAKVSQLAQRTASGDRSKLRVVMAVLVQNMRTIIIKKGKSAGQKMAMLTVEDLSGTVEAVMFADCFVRYGHLLEDDQPKFLLGRIDTSRGDLQVIVDRLVPIDGLPLQKGVLQIFVREPQLNGSSHRALESIADVLGRADDGLEQRHTPDRIEADVSASTQAVPVSLIVETQQVICEVKPAKPIRRVLTPDLARELVDAAGPGSVRLHKGVAVELEKEKKKPWEKRSNA